MLSIRAVREAGAIGVPDKLRGQVVKAFMVAERAGDELRTQDPGLRARSGSPSTSIRRDRRIRRRVAGDSGRQGQSQGTARAEKMQRTDMSDANRLFPKITDDALDALRATRKRADREHIGTLVPRGDTSLRIRHYAHGIGDDNPLWCDPDYAAGTRWGGTHSVAQLPVRNQPDHFRLCSMVACRVCTRCGLVRIGPGICRYCATVRMHTEAW